MRVLSEVQWMQNNLDVECDRRALQEHRFRRGVRQIYAQVHCLVFLGADLPLHHA